MKRGVTNKEKPALTNAQLMTFASQLVGRAQLMSRLGLQYAGDRDVYKALGYPTDLKFEDFLGKFARHEIGKAVIKRPVNATWQGPLELVESDESEDTAFEEEWEKLCRKLKLKTILARVDKLTGIGRYGVLVLGLDDVSSTEGFAKPVKSGVRKLYYVKPFGEKSAKISRFESNPNNERYGLPLEYTIEASDVSDGAESASTKFIKVHYSRVIHITDDPLESEVYGTPRLEAIYNRLMDLDKLVGGDAEMFWRGARPGYEGKVEKDYQMTEEMKDALKEQIDEYENNLRRFLINEGIELKALQQQIADPKGHFDILMACISAETGIPQRVLMGSERGELASTQDSNEWKDYVQARREDHAEPNILRPLVDKLIELKVLPKPVEDYEVKWSDLYAMSEKARVEVGKGRANALREYLYSPMAQGIIPKKAFLEYFLGFTKEQITLTEAMSEEVISEDELNNIILEDIDPPEPKVAPTGTPIPKPSLNRRRIRTK